jgi:hypothetical protein
MFANWETMGPKGEMPEGSDTPRAIVTVRPVTLDTHDRGDHAKEDWIIYDAQWIIYDALVCNADGKFKTERLLPGQYAVVAGAYLPEKYSDSFRGGWRLPGIVGRTVVTVREDGPPPQVTIELETRDKPATTPTPLEHIERKASTSARPSQTKAPQPDSAGPDLSVPIVATDGKTREPVTSQPKGEKRLPEGLTYTGHVTS